MQTLLTPSKYTNLYKYIMQDYNGFVYLWFDTLRKMFYIGSHYGKENDGYIGSGRRFKFAYNKRPSEFRRKILEYVSGDKSQILEREQIWLNLIKDDELNKKYYNQKKFASGGSVLGRKQPKTKEHIEKLRKSRKDTSNFHAPKSPEHKKKISNSLLGIDRSGSKNGMYGKTQSKESRLLQSEMAKNRKKVVCDYCNKEVFPCHLSRNHGTKCPLYVQIVL